MSKKSVVVTPADRSRSRQKRYLFLAFLLAGISIFIPIVLFILNQIAPPHFTIVSLTSTASSSSADDTVTGSVALPVLASETTVQLQSIFFSGQTSLVFCTNQSNPLNVHRLVHKVADLNAVQNENIQTQLNHMEVTEDEEDEIIAQEQEKQSTSSSTKKTRAASSNVVSKGPLLTGRPNLLHIYTMDCHALLPSGKSIIRRFALGKLPLLTSADPKKYVAPPPAFFVTNGDKPKWVPTHMFQNEQTGNSHQH
jgi:hypothetical protein